MDFFKKIPSCDLWHSLASTDKTVVMYGMGNGADKILGVCEKFNIEITKISHQTSSDTKGMVIKITDETLLSKTGGIVQGMSGSPIIQNDKLIGAVTHVFVNDPTRGYGIFIENMLLEAEKKSFLKKNWRSAKK